MKRLALITFSLAALCAAAKNFVAESPDYVAKSTGTINPARIERRGDTTAVTFDVRFNPQLVDQNRYDRSTCRSRNRV